MMKILLFKLKGRTFALMFFFFLITQFAHAGDRKLKPDNVGNFFVYQKNNGHIVIRVIASNDQGCNDEWDNMYIKYVRKNGLPLSLIRFDNDWFSGAKSYKDPNDNIYHYYEVSKGKNIVLTRVEDTDGADLHMEFTWYNPPADIRPRNNFYLTGLWRACTNDWIGDWRYYSPHDTPWMRTCYLVDGGLTGTYDNKRKKDILRYWAPRVYHDTRNDAVNLGSYDYYWEQEIFGPVNFDNDWDARNNWEHNAGNLGSPNKYVPYSYAYGSFVETVDAYYLGYHFFHPTDDSNIPQDRHENDWEELYVCIKKGPENNGFGSFLIMATNSHGNYKSHSAGNVVLSGGHHPQIYITSNGLGVPLGWSSDHGHSIYRYDGEYQRDFGDFAGNDGIVFNISDKADHVTSNPTMHTSLPWFGNYVKYPKQAYYDILDIDEVWSLRETTNHDPFMRYGAFGGEGSNGKGPGAYAPWNENDKILIDPVTYFNNRTSQYLSPTYVYNPYWNGNTLRPEVERPLRGELFAGWSEKEISNNNSVSYFTHGDLTISGKDPYPVKNEFHFMYKPTLGSTGKVELTAKVDRIRQNISSQTKVGLRVSSGTHLNDPFVAISQRTDGKIVFDYRASPSGPVTSFVHYGSPAGSKYLRLNRSGNTWYAYYSVNNTTFTYVGKAELSTSNVNLGIYLDPNSSGKKASVSLTDIEYKLTPNFYPPSGDGLAGNNTGGGGSGGSGGGGSGGDDILPPDGLDDMYSIHPNIFPNPNNGSEFTIQILNEGDAKDMRVSIYNIHGAQLFNKSIDAAGQHTQVELTNMNFENGVYILQVISNEDISTKKFIVKK